LLFWAAGLSAQEVKSRKAPDFTLPDIEGRNYALYENLRPGPTYISFWATWCKPCIEELKIIQKLYEKYREHGFKVVAINTEGPKAMAKIKSFVKSNGMTFTVLLDNDGEIFRRKFKGAAMPFTVIADFDGDVIYSAVGFKPGDEVKIEKIIAANLAPPDTDVTPHMDTSAAVDTVTAPADTGGQSGSEQ
jgi:peroxiredoxin